MPQVQIKTLHLKEPFRIAHGTSATRQVVRISEAGITAEAPFVPYYGESVEATVAWLQAGAQGPGTRAGTLAADLLRAAQSHAPLWQTAQQALGSGRPWGEIFACRSLGIPTDLHAFTDRVRQTAQQFQVLKLKLGSGDLDHDEAIVTTARAAAPHTTLFADVNGGWSIPQTVEMMQRLRPHGLVLIEQPIHHSGGIPAWQELKERLPAQHIPLYADESAQNATDIPALALYVQGINVKLLKCGSFAAAIEMISTARHFQLGILLGCMIESSLGTTAAAHLAPWADWVDLDGHLYLADDDYEGITFTPDGRLHLPPGNGIGAKPKHTAPA